MISWLRDRWYARQRHLDLELLWPAIRRHESDLSRARAAFGFHCLMTPAWYSLGLDQIENILRDLR